MSVTQVDTCVHLRLEAEPIAQGDEEHRGVLEPVPAS